MEIQHWNIRIRGRVQGVFFRSFAKEKADELGLLGFARNEPDGSVFIEAEGEEAALQKFLALCGTGPQFARVEQITAEKGAVAGFSDFKIKI